MNSLTAPARAILAFTVAASLVLTGWPSASPAVATLLAGLDVNNEPKVLAVAVTLVHLAIAGWALFLARGTATGWGDHAWPGHLAGAARVLGVVLIVLFAIQLVGVLLGDGYGTFPYVR